MIQIYKKKNDTIFKDKNFKDKNLNIQTFRSFSYRFWTKLSFLLFYISCMSYPLGTVGGLWLFSSPPLNAMEVEENSNKRKLNSLEGKKSSPDSSRRKKIRYSDSNPMKEERSLLIYKGPAHPPTYNGSEHPLTALFWKIQPSSYRIRQLLDFINNGEKNFNIDLALDDKKVINLLTVEKTSDHFFDINSQFNNSIKASNGLTNSEVHIVHFNSFTRVRKTFENLKEGLKELFNYLRALELNPSPNKFKMARIFDAVIHEGRLVLFLEGAGTNDVSSFLSGNSAENVIIATARFLAEYHGESSQLIDKEDLLNIQTYRDNASKASSTLFSDLLKGQKEIKLFSLAVQRGMLPSDEEVTAENIMFFLSEKEGEKEKLKDLIRITNNHFYENSGCFYRFLKSFTSKSKNSYFAAAVHNDAHIRNIFYNDSQGLFLNDSLIPETSPYRIEIIDFATMDIGDPAGDVGRFLASLWNWAAQQDDATLEIEEKISHLEEIFIQSYLNKIKENKIISEKNWKNFEETFKQNYSFWKLRFIRAVVNSAQSKEIKLKLLRSWMRQNSYLLKGHSQDTNKTNKPSPNHVSLPPEEGVKYCYLPPRPEKFIERRPEGSHKSYQTLLQEGFDDEGRTTTSSKAIALVGLLGSGKKTEVLEYAHKALDNGKYKLIHWISSGTEASLFEGYRKLLLNLGIPNKDADNERIIELVKEHMPKQGRSLIIYDGLSDPYSLAGHMPEKNIDIVITAQNLFSPLWDIQSLSFGCFTLEDSVKYLFEATGLEVNLDNQKVVKNLAYELAGLPLALFSAAHYLKLEYGGNVSAENFKNYIQGLKENSLYHFEKHQNPFKKNNIDLLAIELLPTPGEKYNNIEGEIHLLLGRIYLNQKNYDEAIKWFQKAEEQGVEDAEYWLKKIKKRRKIN